MLSCIKEKSIFANQISSQLQGDKDVDQTAAMAMIEVMPHYDQVLYSMQ